MNNTVFAYASRAIRKVIRQIIQYVSILLLCG